MNNIKKVFQGQRSQNGNGIIVFFIFIIISSSISSITSSSFLEWLDSVVVGRRTSDRKIVGSTPGRCTAG